MKPLFKSLLTVTIALFLVSWGSIGHKTIALIAEHHLTSQAKLGVKAFLQDESLSDVSNWADQVRSQPEYKATASWHYLNLPLGLSYSQFDQAVKGQSEPNVYSAINKCIQNVEDPATSQKQRIEDLKFIVHLVGDAHQPFHVSHKEDKGGNTIQVQFDGRGTNLHSVWDTKLIDHQNLSSEQMAKEYDTATPQQIKQWQGDDVMEWLWESYQLSSKFYKEVNAGDNLGDAYYNEHIGIVKQRIEMAGIRLAGVLNNLLSGIRVTKVTLSPSPPDTLKPIPRLPTVELTNVRSVIGVDVQVRGKVYSFKNFGSMVLVNVGKKYPNQLLTVVLRGKAKELAEQITGKEITINGTVIDYKGKPEIVVKEPEQIIINQ